MEKECSQRGDRGQTSSSRLEEVQEEAGGDTDAALGSSIQTDEKIMGREKKRKIEGLQLVTTVRPTSGEADAISTAWSMQDDEAPRL